MNRRIPFLSVAILALVTAVAPAQQTKEEKYPDGKIKAKYAIDADGKKNGSFVERFPSGSFKIKASYKKDELDGLFTEYYPSGKTSVTVNYKAGKRIGIYTELTEKGQKKLTALYIDGKLNGKLTQYEAGVPTLDIVFKEDRPVYPRSAEQIKKKLAEIDPPDKKADGEAAEREAALRRLKAYRYLCEVPYENMSLDDHMNKASFTGSLLCEKLGRLDHAPKDNPGMSAAEFALGCEGTSKSSLALGPTTLAKAVDGWMDDSDKSNLEVLGHRRWCINPPLARVGFGQSGTYSAMYVFDDSGKNAVPNFDFVAYPARGLMPVEYFGPKHAWNVSLNPAKCKPFNGSERAKIFELDSMLNPVGEPGGRRPRHEAADLEPEVRFRIQPHAEHSLEAGHRIELLATGIERHGAWRAEGAERHERTPRKAARSPVVLRGTFADGPPQEEPRSIPRSASLPKAH